MPPRSMFDRKDRPEGLEFAACEPCNRGAGHADLVAALIGRVYPDASDPEVAAEVRLYLDAVKNNVPGLLEEMFVPAARQKHEFGRRGLDRDAGGFLRLGGPIAMAHLEVFAARLAIAMHFERTGKVMTPDGGVMVRVYSNLELMDGAVPEELFDILPEPQTLSQGRKSVETQFRYGARTAEGDAMTMCFASFRLSFAVLGVAANEVASLPGAGLPTDVKAYRPGALQVVLPARHRIAVSFGTSDLTDPDGKT